MNDSLLPLCHHTTPVLPPSGVWTWETLPDGRLKYCRHCWLRVHGDGQAQVLPGQTSAPILPPLRPVRRQSLDCRHRGAPTGETRQCKTCKGNVEVKLLACALHGKCCLDKLVSDARCCRICPDREPPLTTPPVAPIADVRIGNLPGHAFNGSIAEWQGRTVLCYRQNWANSRLAVVELTDDWQPLRDPHELKLGQLPRDRLGQEDPRLFLHAGSLWVAYSGLCAVKTGPQAWDGGVSVCYARLDDRLQVAESFYPHLEGRQGWEKNWGFFSSAGSLYAVHTIQGQRVLRIDGHQATEAYRSDVRLPLDSLGEPRGGASPVLRGGEYWSFCHTRQPLRSGVYTLCLYTFDATPPFRPRRHVPLPLLRPDPSRRDPNGQQAEVVYPAGAVFRGNLVHVSYGEWDNAIRVASWRIADLEKALLSL